MELFTQVSGVFLSIAAIFGLGWAAHAFFHNRQHDEFKIKIGKLEKELEEAKHNQRVTVRIQNYTPQAIEQLQLSQDEVTLLKFIQREGVFGPPDEMSMSRAQLAGDRLSDKGMTDDDEHGMFVTRLGLEWMERNHLLD